MKMFQTDTITKIQKNYNLQQSYAFFSKFWTDFVDWNVEKGQQGENVFQLFLMQFLYNFRKISF